MSKGWRYESGRHALSARGIMSAAGKRKLGTGPYPSNSKQIKNEVFRRMEEHNMNEIEDPESPGTFIMILDCLATGSEGTHQPSSIAQSLNLEIPKDAKDVEGHITEDWNEYEWAWEEIEEKAGEVADELKKVSGLPGQFYFGHLEDWGDYCLFYSWEVKDHPEFDYSGIKGEHVIENRTEALKAISGSYQAVEENYNPEGDRDLN